VSKLNDKMGAGAWPPGLPALLVRRLVRHSSKSGGGSSSERSRKLVERSLSKDRHVDVSVFSP